MDGSYPNCLMSRRLLQLALLLQHMYQVWHAQQVLGNLYERVFNSIRARGVPPEDETVLWACLARIRDPKTGEACRDRPFVRCMHSDVHELLRGRHPWPPTAAALR